MVASCQGDGSVKGTVPVTVLRYTCQGDGSYMSRGRSGDSPSICQMEVPPTWLPYLIPLKLWMEYCKG
jgi:hypothetical protein